MSPRVAMERRFTLLGCSCYVDPTDDRRYYFLPSAPDVRRDASGLPMITVVDVGSAGYVMFTATWTAPGASMDALKFQIANERGGPDAGPIRLSIALVSEPRCHALIGDGHGAFERIATSATSGVPPYDALFNVPVPQERLDHVKRAAKGERGFLAVEYAADLMVPAAAAAVFRSRSSDLLPWLRGRVGSDAPIQGLLEEAVGLGLATVTFDPPDCAGGAVSAELLDRILSQAAQAAPRWITEGDRGHFEVEATAEWDEREPVRAFADIGDIVAGGSAWPS
jgi:hypothetical protein